METPSSDVRRSILALRKSTNESKIQRNSPRPSSGLLVNDLRMENSDLREQISRLEQEKRWMRKKHTEKDIYIVKCQDIIHKYEELLESLGAGEKLQMNPPRPSFHQPRMININKLQHVGVDLVGQSSKSAQLKISGSHLEGKLHSSTDEIPVFLKKGRLPQQQLSQQRERLYSTPLKLDSPHQCWGAEKASDKGGDLSPWKSADDTKLAAFNEHRLTRLNFSSLGEFESTPERVKKDNFNKRSMIASDIQQQSKRKLVQTPLSSVKSPNLNNSTLIASTSVLPSLYPNINDSASARVVPPTRSGRAMIEKVLASSKVQKKSRLLSGEKTSKKSVDKQSNNNSVYTEKQKQVNIFSMNDLGGRKYETVNKSQPNLQSQLIKVSASRLQIIPSNEVKRRLQKQQVTTNIAVSITYN